jgi:hypothetical protein
MRSSGAGGKEPLAVEPTQDAAIERARKLEADAAIHVERFATSRESAVINRGGSDGASQRRNVGN